MSLIASSASAESLIDTEFSAWKGALEQRTLADDSVLSEYVASTETRSSDGSGTIVLLVSFMPRFECAPLVGLRFPDEHAALAAELFDDGDSVNFTLDKKAVDMPVAVDDDGTVTTLWLLGNADAQRAMRALFDVGSRTRVVLSDTIDYNISLLGSQGSLDATEKHCLIHEPIPYK